MHSAQDHTNKPRIKRKLILAAGAQPPSPPPSGWGPPDRARQLGQGQGGRWTGLAPRTYVPRTRGARDARRAARRRAPLGQGAHHRLCYWDGVDESQRPELRPIASYLIVIDAVSERPTITVQLTDDFKRVLEIARANLAKAKEDNGQA